MKCHLNLPVSTCKLEAGEPPCRPQDIQCFVNVRTPLMTPQLSAPASWALSTATAQGHKTAECNHIPRHSHSFQLARDLSYHAWYLDDGVLASPRPAVLQALSIIQEIGPPNGLIVNFHKSISALEAFDHNIRATFSKCTVVDTSNQAWQQAELSLSRGGLGIRSLSQHSQAAYIASLSSSGAVPLSQEHLIHAVELFNSLVPSSEAVSMEEVLTSRIHQKVLSNKIDNHLFNILYEQFSAADRACLLSVSSPHAASLVSVILHLQPSEFQVAIKWWLGLDTSCGSIFPLCPGRVSDPLGHHALTCKRGGDVVTGHDKLRDTLAETCRRAHLSVKALTSAGIAPNNNETWELIQSKHPKGPPPIPPAPSTPPIPILSKDFNIAMVLRSFPKSTACGPSGLRIQHFLDTAEVPLQFPISSSLRDIVNLLASGKVPVSVSRHLAGGSLTALVKGKPGLPPDICPIAVGEALRRLTGKCLCAVLKSKTSEFFAPFQFGVACPAGAEKVIHGLRHCIEEHWEEEDFVVLKIDMCNAFNLVSRQALLDECAFHFPDLLPWASWCYGQQPLLQHPLGTVTSEVGVQQGDPLGPMFFSLAWLNLHLEPAEFQAAIQWWLGIGVAHGSLCPHCPHSLDPLGHHALTCKHGGDVINRHNRLRDVFAESCRRACIGVQVEAGSGLGRDEHHTWPADVLATNWMLGKPAAFDFAVTSPLNSSTLHEASVTAGSAAHATEARKHQANDVKCAELGWVSIPVVVETIRDILVEICRRAHIGIKVEVGNNLSRDHSKTRPANILLPNWFLGRTAALDVSITSPLNPVTLLEAGVSATAAAQATEARKHQANDPKCSELGWPTSTCRPKSTILHEIYGRLNLNLVCANATAILSRIAPPP
eukprot:Em0024g132a